MFPEFMYAVFMVMCAHVNEHDNLNDAFARAQICYVDERLPKEILLIVVSMMHSFLYKRTKTVSYALQPISSNY